MPLLGRESVKPAAVMGQQRKGRLTLDQIDQVRDLGLVFAADVGYCCLAA